MTEYGKTETELLKLPTITHDNTPHFFVDGFWGLVVLDGVVRMNLYRLHYSLDSGIVQKEIVATIAIPEGSLWKVLDALGEFRSKKEIPAEEGARKASKRAR
jgi:hypothetical protein